MDEKISQLDNYTPPADTDVFPIVDVGNGITKKITFANLKTEIVGDDTAFVRKADYDANSILYATSDNTPLALTVGTNSVVGRVGGAITTLAVDSDLTSVSASDDTVPSAKATKTALDLKATDSAVVHDTGAESIDGVKTFTSDPIIPDEAYGSGWNGVLEPATKNAIYDKIETLSSGSFNNGTTTKDATDASTTQNIAHGLGKTPKKVRIVAIAEAITGAGDSVPAFSETVYNGTTQSSVSMYSNGTAFQGGAATVATTFTLNISGSSATQTGVVTFDSTNIIITWTKTGSPTGSYTLLWEAEA